MQIVESPNGALIRLTDERWGHISHHHPEMKPYKAAVLECLSRPDMIVLGDRGALLAIRSYKGSKYPAEFLVVVFREINERDGFVLTAYFTRRPSAARKIIWKR